MGDPGHGRFRLGAAGASSLLVMAALVMAVANAASGSDGTWDRVWGEDVDQGGGTGFEICTVAASCKDGGVSLAGFGGDVYFPSDVATDAAGNVYVANSNWQRIEKFDSSGNWLRAWGKDVVSGGGTGFEICTTATSCKPGSSGGLGGEFMIPTAVATDTTGNVYVADSQNYRIQKFDSSGNFLLTWGRDVHSGGMVEAEVCSFAASCQAGLSGGLGGEFSEPSGIAVESSGNIYVTEFGNRRVQKFTSNATFLRTWGKDVDTGGDTGAEVCTDPADCKIGGAGVLAGEFGAATGVAVDSAGNIHVADRTNHRIQKFNSVGDFQRAWGKDVVSGGGTGFEVCTPAETCKAGVEGGLGGEFDLPDGIAADDAGQIYVSELDNHRIQVFDLSGGFQRAWGRDVGVGGGGGFELCTLASSCKVGIAGTLGGELNTPRGLGTDGAGNVYLADTGNDRVQKFTTALPPLPLPPPPEIDTGLPETTIIAGPKPKTKSKTASFEFSSSKPGSSFQCKLDDGAFEPCSSPFSAKVKKGKHTFTVRATDAAGNTDPTPATQSWKVKKKKKKKT